jgi:hypothetical protein
MIGRILSKKQKNNLIFLKWKNYRKSNVKNTENKMLIFLQKFKILNRYSRLNKILKKDSFHCLDYFPFLIAITKRRKKIKKILSKMDTNKHVIF